MLSRLGSAITRCSRSKSRRSSESHAPEQRIPLDSPPRQQQRRWTTQLSGHGLGGTCRNGLGDDFCGQAVVDSFNDDDELNVASCAASVMNQPEPDASMCGALSLSTRIEYTALARGRSQDVFGLITVQAESAPPEAATQDASTRQPIDVTCVLDVSGSMSGDKIRLLQDAVRFVVDELRPDDRLSLVAFNQQATRPLRLCRMDATGKDEAHRQAVALGASGGTSIANGLEMGLAVMEQRRQRNAVSAILLLTDGQDFESRRRLPALVERARQMGCSLYTFGFGADHDADLLSNVSEQAQTPFSYIEDVDAIRATFAGAVGGLVSVAAQRIELVLECRCALKTAHTPFQVHRTSEANATVQIPDMLAGERRDILVELCVPAEAASSVSSGGEQQMVLLEARARYWDLGRSAVAQTPPVSMLASRSAADQVQPELELEPDAEVCAQRCRVEATQALTLAREHGDAGRYQEAQGVLAAGRSRLASAPKTQLGDAMQLELEAAEARLQDRASWEDGGRAELADMCQMNRMQRATNLNHKSKCAVRRTSMGMYTNSVQKSWVSRSSM